MSDKGYRTSNVNEAAWLYSVGNENFPEPPADWDGTISVGESTWFVFQDELARKQQRTAYMEGEAVGNIRDFVEARNLLLDTINGGRRRKSVNF